jgi:hypothetical protein
MDRTPIFFPMVEMVSSGRNRGSDEAIFSPAVGSRGLTSIDPAGRVVTDA